ncbi:hypothetical protein ACLIYP_03280 [Streptomyces nanhaiensis]|uniref:hypothetical protein n=1 Tax=Streptomyces nanhaiensis TaxID=679319 RepID=UPI00399CE484
MSGRWPAAYRAEAVAYLHTPRPRMFHLGDCFSAHAGEVQWWAGERAVRIAASLGPDDPGAAARLLAWGHEAAADRTHRLLRAGRAVVYSHAGAECLWEISLRPVPQDPAPGRGQGPGPGGGVP